MPDALLLSDAPMPDRTIFPIWFEMKYEGIISFGKVRWHSFYPMDYENQIPEFLDDVSRMLEEVKFPFVQFAIIDFEAGVNYTEIVRINEPKGATNGTGK